jgi:hypothetical protein
MMKASIAIDGGPPFIYVPTDKPATVTTNQLFFTSSGLSSEGNHTLVVTAENENPVWIDYLLVSPSQVETKTSSPFAPSSIMQAEPFTLPSILPLSSNTPSNIPTFNPIHGGEIAGAAVGGLACGGLAAVAFFLICRRHRRSRKTIST